MARVNYDRPDGKQVRQMIAKCKELDHGLSQVLGQEEQQKAAARAAAQALYDYRVQQELERMDVEHINNGKQGLRVGLLREAGVNNVYQASRMSYQQLCAIDGLGEKSARRIREITTQILDNTKNTIRIRIRVDDAHETDLHLIQALHTLIRCREPRQECARVYQQNHAPMQGELVLAEQSLGGFAWMFRGKGKKDQILTAVEALQGRMAGEFGSGKALADYRGVLNAGAEACLEDYIRNAPVYYSELERLGLEWCKETSTPGGLPEQLTAEIEAQELDLQYLKATLRGYQTFGTKYIVHQKKSLLGDEMGLGKTIQAIAAMAAMKAAGVHHFMVVCPASVLINWCREIEKHSTLEVTKVHGNDEASLLHWRENGDVAVTTYESISRFAIPERFKIGMVVTDEAHYVKNPDTIRTKALMKLLRQTENVLFMSGTPLENRVEEMHFLVQCLQPEVAQGLKKVMFLSTAQQFRQQLAPVYLRRTREDVLQELPELVEKEQWCSLNPKEQAVYRDAVLSGNFMAIRQVSWQVDDLKDSSKAMRLLELCDQAKEQGRKVIVFSFFRNTLKKVTELLGQRCMEPITGDISPQRRQEIVDEFAAAEDGAVLVSQVQAGGTGLNIQSASVIIFCEPQIKPSIENQAISRAYRMGQVRDVLVYRLLADDTIDEQMLEILQGKQEQFDSFADESVVGEESLKPSEQAWITRMVEEERKRLLEKE